MYYFIILQTTNKLDKAQQKLSTDIHTPLQKRTSQYHKVKHMTRCFAGENFLMPKKATKGFGFLWISMRKEKFLKREDTIQSHSFFIFVISLFHFCISNKKGQTDTPVNLARCYYVSFQGKNIHKFIECENLSSFLVLQCQDESNVSIEFCQKQKPGFMGRLMWSALRIVIKP